MGFRLLKEWGKATEEGLRAKVEEKGEFPVTIRWKESHPKWWQKQAGSQMDFHAICPYQQTDFRNCGPPNAQGLSSLLVIKKKHLFEKNMLQRRW